MSKRAYQTMDIAVFTVLACLFELINIVSLKAFSLVFFTLSVSMPIAVIVCMRWRAWAAVVVVASSAVFCAVMGASAEQFIIYIVGNSAFMLSLVWFVWIKREKITSSLLLTLGFTLSVFVLMVAGKSVVAAVLGHGFIQSLTDFAGNESLNLAMGLLIVGIARNQKGLLEDGFSFVSRVQDEEKEDGTVSIAEMFEQSDED